MNPSGLHLSSLLRAIIALGLAVLLSLWCWWAIGAGLGSFLGMAVLTSIFLPPLVLAEDGIGRLLVAVAAVIGVGVVWAASTGWADITIAEWLAATTVLAAFAWSITGFTSLLVAVRFPKPLAAALTILPGLLWLTWPVWLSHGLTQSLVNWLVPANPCFAINSVLKHLGTWDRAPLAYNTLTVLNQDVAYRLPKSIWPAVLVHLLIGVPGIWLALRDRSRFTDSPVPAFVPPESP